MKRQPRGSKLLKRVDRIAGIALLAPFALWPKRRGTAVHQPQRIGLLKSAAIGDTLLLAGLLTDLRAAHPNATIVFIVGPDNRAAAELLPGCADEHIVISPRNPLAAVRAIRRAKLDVIVDLGAWPRFDSLLATLSGARCRIGFQTSGQFRHFGFDRVVTHDARVHERDNYARILAELGVEARTPPDIIPPGVLETYPDSPYVIFHPWSSGYMRQVKEWPADRWRALAAELHALRYTILLSGGPGDVENNSALLPILQSTGATVIDIAGQYSLAELADLLSRSQLVVSVNTGVMHLAAQVGARTVSLEGPTPAWRWGGLGPRYRPVASVFADSGYLNLGFEYDGHRHDCMEGISVSDVLAAIDELASAGDRRTLGVTIPSIRPAIS